MCIRDRYEASLLHPSILSELPSHGQVDKMCIRDRFNIIRYRNRTVTKERTISATIAHKYYYNGRTADRLSLIHICITVTEFDTETMKLRPETARTIYAGTDVKLVEGPHLYRCV